jgi:hypothetical protein
MANEFKIKKGLIVNETDLYVSESKAGVGTTSPDANLHVSGSTSNNRLLQVGSNYLVVTGSNGYVGIGTTSPSSLLDLESSSTVGTQLHLVNTSIGGTDWRLVSAGSANSINAGYFGLYNSGWRMVVNDSGNVGIGTTSPDQKLEVEGNIRLGTGGTIYGDTNNPSLTLNNSNGTFLRYTTSHYIGVGAGVIRLVTGGSDRLYISSSGNVGIGTTSPSAKLHVDGDAIITGKVTAQEFHTEFVSASIIYQSGSTKFGDTSDDIHSFSGSLRVTGSGDHYFTDGNVGIGTTSPDDKLHVVGNLFIENLSPEITLETGASHYNWQIKQLKKTLMQV